MEGPAARYQFWPSVAQRHAASVLLRPGHPCAFSSATTFNERMHSPAECIFSDLRNSLKQSSVENLTLALFYLRKWRR